MMGRSRERHGCVENGLHRVQRVHHNKLICQNPFIVFITPKVRQSSILFTALYGVAAESSLLVINVETTRVSVYIISV